MCATAKHSQLKKTPAGESGSSKRTPSHGPGIVSADPAGASYMTYAEQLKSPKWQKKRLEVLNFYGFSCQKCESDSKTLNVHHIIYHSNHKIWDYDILEYSVLCDDCHKAWHDFTDKLVDQIFYYHTNLIGFNITDLLQVLYYLEFMDSDKFDEFVKEAYEFKYPYNT